MSEGVDAAIFYLSVTALVVGTVRTLRASIERRIRDRLGLALAVTGLIGLGVAVMLFALGPKTVLPF